MAIESVRRSVGCLFVSRMFFAVDFLARSIAKQSAQGDYNLVKIESSLKYPILMDL